MVLSGKSAVRQVTYMCSIRFPDGRSFGYPNCHRCRSERRTCAELLLSQAVRLATRSTAVSRAVQTCACVDLSVELSAAALEVLRAAIERAAEEAKEAVRAQLLRELDAEEEVTAYLAALCPSSMQ